MSELKVGDMAPDFELTSDTGEKMRLSDFRGKKVVLYFYPKDMTSGCTAQACGFRDEYPVIEEKNAVVLGVSPDSADSHRRFRSKHNLPFTLLVDENHAVAETYGVWGEKSIIRSHFVVDEEGRLIDVQVKISPEQSVEKAVAALD